MTPRTPQTPDDEIWVAALTDVLCRASFGKFTPDDMARIARQQARAIQPLREREARALPDPTEPALIEKVRALATEYERMHAQSEIDAAEFGPKAGAHGRWNARKEGVEAVLAILEADAGLRSGALPPAPEIRTAAEPFASTYDPEAEAVYVRLSSNQQARTYEVDEGVNVDVDADDVPIGVEVLNVTRTSEPPNSGAPEIDADRLARVLWDLHDDAYGTDGGGVAWLWRSSRGPYRAAVKFARAIAAELRAGREAGA